ncbi:Fungalysin/Thermolysin Extracellular metalloproteinase 5 [Phlyctochytrium bullatum]|nr:Fungalysin/Thermolysin Extracellular metalloproteinase 5 [Phlyctochytrium bullatum]
MPDFWMPATNFIFPEGVEPAPAGRPVSMDDATKKGFQWIQNRWSLQASEYKLVSRYVLWVGDAVASQATDSGLTFLSVQQLVNGVPVANAVANVNLDTKGQVISGAGCIVPKDIIATAPKFQRRDTEPLSALDALKAFATAKGLEVGEGVKVEEKTGGEVVIRGAKFDAEIPASVKYYRTQAGTLEKAWDLAVQLQNDDWLNAFVSTTTGQVLGVSNWVSRNLFENFNNELAKRDDLPTDDEIEAQADSTILIPDTEDASEIPPTSLSDDSDDSDETPLEKRSTPPPRLRRRQNPANARYAVVPLGFADPIDNGNRFTTLTNPADPVASRNGWHDLGQGSRSETAGNNVVASSNPQNSRNAAANPRIAANNFQFVSQFAPNVASTPGSAAAAAGVVNMFYVINQFHDMLSRFGFDEPAGNFQLNNFGRGGRGGDPVVATAQDGSGVNNANFASPPDGIPGRMRMFLFTRVPPSRDAALENDIVIHEMGHGVSNRLTGGPALANCLQRSQSGGMGEGWSDFFGLMTQMKETDTRDTDKGVGVFATGRRAGVRRFAYSTSLQRNPRTYANLATINPRDVHSIGEVWASMLFEVYWNMVDAKGFTPVLEMIPQRDSGSGNTDLFKLVLEGMKIQPCNPTLVQARDAILQADRVRFGGANRCEIARGFAKRGLGAGVRDDGNFVNNFDVPQGC